MHLKENGVSYSNEVCKYNVPCAYPWIIPIKVNHRHNFRIPRVHHQNNYKCFTTNSPKELRSGVFVFWSGFLIVHFAKGRVIPSVFRITVFLNHINQSKMGSKLGHSIPKLAQQKLPWFWSPGVSKIVIMPSASKLLPRSDGKLQPSFTIPRLLSRQLRHSLHQHLVLVLLLWCSTFKETPEVAHVCTSSLALT